MLAKRIQVSAEVSVAEGSVKRRPLGWEGTHRARSRKVLRESLSKYRLNCQKNQWFVSNKNVISG